MSTAATSETGAPTLLVVRPAIMSDPDTSGGNVLVKLEPRQAQAPAGTAPGRTASPVRRKPGGPVVALDPQTPEQEVVGMLSSKVALAVLEVISGVRSVQQLARWLDVLCLSALTTRARLHAEACRARARRQSREGGAENVHTLHHQPIVHSVHCSNISPGIYETSVVMADKTRFRAVAMRFELVGGLWKVTALNIG